MVSEQKPVGNELDKGANHDLLQFTIPTTFITAKAA